MEVRDRDNESKHKVYRSTERRLDIFVPTREYITSSLLRCRYCNNIFYGADRRSALEHMHRHITRKHPGHTGGGVVVTA